MISLFELMKIAAIATLVYALLVAVGGIIGYLQAQSAPSLISGVLFGIALLVCSALTWQGNVSASYVAGAMTVFLALFFGYRFLNTNKFMPGGMMLILSFLALFFLLLGIFLHVRK